MQKKYLDVMLVDDDRFMLEFMKNYINWKGHGFRVVATASDGRKAYAKALKLRPDIIFCDACMPEMDGLDFAEAILKELPQLYLVMLSAYKDFQYIRRAMLCGARDYLLKDELSEGLMLQKLEKAREILLNQQQQLTEQIQSALNDYIVYGGTVSEFMESRILPLNVAAFLKKLSAQTLHYYIFTVQKSFDTRGVKVNEQEKYLPILYEIVKELSLACEEGSYSAYGSSTVVLGLTAQDYRVATSRFGLNRLADTVVARAMEKIGCRAVAFAFDHTYTLSEFGEMLSRNKKIIEFYSAIPLTRFKLLTDHEQMGQVAPVQFDYSLIEKCQDSPGDFLTQMKTYVLELYASKDFYAMNQFFANCYYHFQKLNVIQEEIVKKSYYESKESLIEDMENSYLECLENLKMNNKNQYSVKVFRAVQYIESNFRNKNISIDEIADHVGLSKGRLCVKFKEEVGVTVGDWLTNLRLRYATYLLTNSNMKIYEIAQACGYETSQYFSKLFEKKRGKRPIDVRRNS